MGNIIFFDINHSIDKDGLIDWASSKIGRNQVKAVENVRMFHSEEVENIVNYLLTLYGGTFVSPYTLSKSLDMAIIDLGYTIPDLTNSIGPKAAYTSLFNR